MSLFASDQSTVIENIQKAFMKSIEPLQSVLQWYCRTVTGSTVEVTHMRNFRSLLRNGGADLMT